MNLIQKIGKYVPFRSKRSNVPVTDLPSSLLNLSNMQSIAGVTVNEQTALSVPAFLCGVRRIAQDVARLPINIMRMRPDGGMQRDLRHPLNKLFLRPNPENTRMDLMQALVANAILYGTGYAQIIRNGYGDPVQLWPIESFRIMPWRDENWNLFYHVYPGATYPIDPRPNTTKTIPHEDMYCLKAFNTNGIIGAMITRMGKESIGLSIALQQYAASIFGNGARPGGVLTYPKVLKKEAADKLLADFEAMHQGSEAGHRTALLQDGMGWTKISSDPEESQMIQSRYLQIEDAARLLDVTPQKLHHLVKTSFNSIEALGISYTQDTISPYLVRGELEGKAKLISEEDVYIDIDESELLRGDFLSVADACGKLHLSGLGMKNELRIRLGLNPVEGGDVFLEPKNSVPIGKDDSVEKQQQLMLEGSPPEKQAAPVDPPAAEPADAPSEEQDQLRTIKLLADAHRPIILDAVQRLLRVESDKVIRAAKKDGFSVWTEEFYKSHAEHVRSALNPAFTAFGNSAVAVRGQEPSKDLIDGFIRTKNSLAEKYLQDSRSDLADLDGLEQRVKHWIDHRADAFVQAALDELVEAVSHDHD